MSGEIVNVSQLFAIREQLHQGDDVRLNEAEAAAMALADHRTRIMNVVTMYSPAAAEKVYTEWLPLMRTSLVLPQEEEAAGGGSVSAGQDEEFEVGYRNHDQPHMFIGVNALQYAAKLFDVLLYDTADNSTDRRQHCIEAASVVLGGLAMGKWIFDVLDSSDRNLRTLNRDALEGIVDISIPGSCLPSLPPLHDGTELDTEAEQVFAEQVRMALSVARYRQAGRLAYDALTLYGHERHWQTGLSEDNLTLFSRLYCAALESQLENTKTPPSTLQFALSYPIHEPVKMTALYSNLLAL